jgi:hypothetical protein
VEADPADAERAKARAAAITWAAAVRQTYQLDATQEQLVALAVEVLTLALDPQTSAPVRLSAMNRYQRLVKDLAFEPAAPDRAGGSVPDAPVRTPVAPRPRPAVDPRAILMAVK